jgi:hypothetical protein
VWNCRIEDERRLKATEMMNIRDLVCMSKKRSLSDIDSEDGKARRATQSELVYKRKQSRKENVRNKLSHHTNNLALNRWSYKR